MGQRLVVSVQSCGENIARIYYHWSAYTRSALSEARDIIECICSTNAKSEKEIQLALIHMCEKNGGGINGGIGSVEGIYIQNMFPNEEFKKESPDRSYGLIAITESGMNDMMLWAEGELTIDIDERMVYNDVFLSFSFDSWKETYAEDVYGKTKEELDSMTLDDIEQLRADIGEFSFNEIDMLIRQLDICVENSIYTTRYENVVYELIE